LLGVVGRDCRAKAVGAAVPGDRSILRSVAGAASEPVGDAAVVDTPPTSSVQNRASLGRLHRMGDCGYLDAAGRLWFCGRVVERVQTASGDERGRLGAATLYTEPCEQVFRAHPQVARCALIGLGPAGSQTPALVVQARAAKATKARHAVLARELRGLALAHEHTAKIERFYFHPDFPVDVRHNAKIHRLTLARWAATARVFRA